MFKLVITNKAISLKKMLTCLKRVSKRIISKEGLWPCPYHKSISWKECVYIYGLNKEHKYLDYIKRTSIKMPVERNRTCLWER